jgi:DNA mismatch repair protein MutS
MVEMMETANILHHATERSLVVLDEVGRGTSTYDGVALAWAITEHLARRVRCRTLFATHYHELTALPESADDLRERVGNLRVAVREWGDRVVFLRRIEEGGTDRSYGVHVARLAGLPAEVLGRATAVLASLEDSRRAPTGEASPAPAGAAEPAPPEGSRTARRARQLPLFEPPEHPVLAEIRRTDPDRITPIEALQRLAAWAEAVRRAT